MNAPTIELKILDERARHTQLIYGTSQSAGLDLRACLDSPLTLLGDSASVRTGVAIHIGDPGIGGFIFPRSGLGAHFGIVLGNGTGVIDPDYQGELVINLWNRTDIPYTIAPMDRIAQIVFMPVIHPFFCQVEEFTASERGTRDFGSTGLK